MKAVCLPFLALMLVSFNVSNSFAQCSIPNSSFQNWTSGLPDGGWIGINIQEWNEGQTGGKSVQFLPNPVLPIPPLLFNAYPCTQKSNYLNGYIKANFSNPGDTLMLTAFFKKQGDTTTVALGVSYTNVSRATFQPFHIPISAFNQALIDSVYISAILISGGFTSTAMLDVLAFSNTSIGQPLGPSLTTSTSNLVSVPKAIPSLSIFPNPVNRFSEIALTGLNSDFTEIILSDLSGKLIRSLYKGKGDPSFRLLLDVKGLHSGIYLVQAKNGKGVITKKIVVE